MAAGEPFVFNVTLGNTCVAGYAPASTDITVRLLSANDAFQGKIAFESGADGTYHKCGFWNDIDPGDKIVAEGGGFSRTFTVPDVRFTANRVTDVISGKAPANSSVDIIAYDCQDFSCELVDSLPAATSATGAFSLDWTATHNLRGDDFVGVRWADPFLLDQVHATRRVPTMSVTLDNAEAGGWANPLTQAKLQLRTATGTLRGTMKDTSSAYDGRFVNYFRASDGSVVNPKVGNKVIGSFSTDANLTVIATALAGNPATNVVTGKCYPNRAFYLYAEDPAQNRNPSWTDYYGTTNSSGNFSVDIAALGSEAGFDLADGDQLQVLCRTGKGDTLEAFGEV